ncbi:MAG: LytR C-terminal domain-containing protein [Pseudonocardiales bacterium]
MGTPNGIGTGRRMRIAGLALLGLAVIAALIGLVVATNRGEPTPAAVPPAVTSTPDSTPAIPSTIPYPPTSSPAAVPQIPGGAAADSRPPAAGAGAGAGADAGAGAGAGASAGDNSRSRGEVRVYNNSTISGLAARAAEDLTAAGWTVVEVGNYARGTIPTTTAYYQDGTDRDDAEALGAEFGMRVESRFPGIANAGPGLIVIVTNDYVSP